jgi:hypothetical protein
MAGLATLDLGPGDEVLVADNTPDGVLLSRPGAEDVGAFACSVTRSAYAARNLAAERARNDWLLFLDGDVEPRPDLLDRFFDEPPAPTTGAVAGQVLGSPDQPGAIPAYIRARRHLDQAWLMHEHPFRPMAVTANLLVRKAAWASIGGFAELTRSGADADLCWRLADAGWDLELREDALVHHEHRASLGALLRQSARDGAGANWLARRYSGFAPRPKMIRELVRAAGGSVIWVLRGDRRSATHKLIDGAWAVAAAVGSMQSNAAPVTRRAASRVVFLTDFPSADDLVPDDGSIERIEALGRPPVTQDWATGRRAEAHLVEDDGVATRLTALIGLLVRRPGTTIRALAAEPARVAALAPAARRRLADAPGAEVISSPARAADAALVARLAGRAEGAQLRTP